MLICPCPSAAGPTSGTAVVRTPITASVEKPKGPPLPLEIIQRVIDYAVLDFRASEDSSVLQALLHTSCKVRALLVESFAPIRLKRSEMPRKLSEDDLDRGYQVGSCAINFPPRVFQYIEELLQLVLLRDFSTRRFSSRFDEPRSSTDTSVVVSTERDRSTRLIARSSSSPTRCFCRAASAARRNQTKRRRVAVVAGSLLEEARHQARCPRCRDATLG